MPTFLERYEAVASDNWFRKAKIIYLFHSIQSVRNRKWRLQDTAAYFKLSKGYVSEALLIINYQHKIDKNDSRNQALKTIRSLN